jgi:hypothetical protein
MIQPISTLAATAQSALDDSQPIFETLWNLHSMQLFTTGDSIWWVVTTPNEGRMAFRLAYGMNSPFQKVNLKEDKQSLHITAATELGNYTIIIQFIKDSQVTFRYTTTFRTKLPFIIPYFPRDIVPLTLAGKTENTTGDIHVHQAGSRSGLLFFSTTSPKENTVFYFQNLTALSDYCEDTRTAIAETVGGTWPDIGFQLPVSEEPLQEGKEYCFSDAFVLLTETIPADPFAISEQFLDYLAATYLLLPKPETHYWDWLDISEKSLEDLCTNKGAWTYSNGHPYLNAYLCDYKTPPEIMVQLCVLYAIWEYNQWTGQQLKVIDEIKGGLPSFYDEKLKTISRWLPALRSNLDESEEQKAPMTMDSWYLHHPLMNLAKLALDGHTEARKLLLDSIEYAIQVAHKFDYTWPVFYKMDTLEILKEETAPGMGGEKDVGGAYAYLMLLTYELTNEKRYLEEAKRAAKRLQEYGLTVFYQANNTAFSALALLRLYKITGDLLYLRISYMCLGGIMKNVQLSDSNYGNSKHFFTFFGVFPLNDAPYRAAYEELEVYTALNDYIKEATEMQAPIPDSLKLLLPEFVRYSLYRLPYYYPPLLPEDILAEEIKTGELDPKLWIPIEDLYDGWDENGQVGQEVYGAGVGFGVVPRQFIKLEGEELLLFCDYPILNFRKTKKQATFRIIGLPSMQCSIKVIRRNQSKNTVHIAIKESRAYKELSKTTNPDEFSIPANSNVRITW